MFNFYAVGHYQFIHKCFISRRSKQYSLIIFPMVIFQTNPVILGAVGGIILGIATSINFILRGKVTGMSGICFGIVSLNKDELAQKLTIVAGMFIASGAFYLGFNSENYDGFQPFGPDKQIAIITTYPGYALAGFLVGFGTKFMNGCTSGHGLCGIARLSFRSMVAVCIFLFTAIGIGTLGYYLPNRLWPFSIKQQNESSLLPYVQIDHTISAGVVLGIGVILPIISLIVAKKFHEQFTIGMHLLDQAILLLVGMLFAIGLMTSGMSRRLNIIQFLQLGKDWSPVLLFVLMAGLIVNTITFSYMIYIKKNPIFGKSLFNPKSKPDIKLIIGSVCFGLGWGIGGLCPGPFLVLFAAFTIPIQIIWGISMIVGMFCAHFLGQWIDNALKKAQQSKQQADKGSSELSQGDRGSNMLKQQLSH